MYYCFGIISLLVVLSAATPFNVNYPPADTLSGDTSGLICMTVAVPSAQVAATRNVLIFVYRSATAIVGGPNASVSFVEQNAVEVYDGVTLELVQVIRVSKESCSPQIDCVCNAIVTPTDAILMVHTGIVARRFVLEFDDESISHLTWTETPLPFDTLPLVIHDALLSGPYAWDGFVMLYSVANRFRLDRRKIAPFGFGRGTQALEYNPFVGGVEIVGLDIFVNATTFEKQVILSFENGYICVTPAESSPLYEYVTNCKLLPFGPRGKYSPAVETTPNGNSRVVTLRDNRAIVEDFETTSFVSPYLYAQDESRDKSLLTRLLRRELSWGRLIRSGTNIPVNTVSIYAKDFGTDHPATYNLSTPLLEGQEYVFLVGGVKDRVPGSTIDSESYSFQTPEVTIHNGETSTTLASFVEVAESRVFCLVVSGCEGSYFKSALAFTPNETGKYILSRTLEPALTHGYLMYMTMENYLPLLPAKEQDVLCCSSSELDRAKMVGIGDQNRLVTHADDSTLQVWRLDELGEGFPLESVLQVLSSEGLPLDTEPDFFVYETAPDETSAFRVVTYSKGPSGDVYVFDVSLDPTQSSYAIYILVFNYAVLVSLFTFTVFVSYYKARKPVEGTAGSDVPFGTRLMTVLGLYPSLRYFDVLKLKGFATERFLRWLPVPRKSLALTVYMIFVLVMFSPNVNPATSTASSTQCEHSAAKLAGIGQAALQDLNHDDARLKYEESVDRLTELTSRLLNIRTNSNGALFSNWPNATEDACETVIAAAYAEAKKQLTSECDAHISCEDAFVGLKGGIIDGLAFFFERSFEAFKRRFARIEEKCIPERGTKVPCEIDTSVVTDLIAAQDLLNKYQEVPKQLPQTVDRVEESTMREIEHLLFLVTLGSDLFVVFTIVTIYLSVPLKLYRSSLTLRLQRAFFATTQLQFVVVAVLAIWTIPYILELLSIENIRLFLHSANEDSCYVQPSFLGAVASDIVSACSTMDHLEQQYYTVQYQLRDMNVTANQYKTCSSDILYGSLSNIFEQLDAASRAVDEPFSGRICDQAIMGDLRRKFSVAPGEPPSDAVTFIYALAFLCRLCGVLIFARYGLSFTNVFAPILLHDGQAEAEKGAKLPPTRQVERFFSSQRFPGFVVDSTLVLFYFMSTISYLTLSRQVDATEEARLGLLVAGIVTCLFLCMFCCMLVR